MTLAAPAIILTGFVTLVAVLITLGFAILVGRTRGRVRIDGGDGGGLAVGAGAGQRQGAERRERGKPGGREHASRDAGHRDLSKEWGRSKRERFTPRLRAARARAEENGPVMARAARYSDDMPLVGGSRR